MENMEQMISRYAGAWDEQTPEAVKAAFEQCCAPEITYTDRNTKRITGIDALTDLVMASHALFPGRTFAVLSTPEYFDGQCHYKWGVNLPGIGQKEGWDFMEYDEQNKITRIVGFVPVLP